MKKIVSLFMIFVFSFALCTTAFAVDTTNSEGERVVLTPEEYAAFEASKNNAEINQQEDTSNDDSARVIGYAHAGITEIIGYPLMADLNTGEAFYYPHINSKVTFTSINQHASLRLTSNQAARLYSQAITYLSNNIPTEGHSYAIVGWYVETLVQLRADDPRYLEYRIAEPNFNQGTGYDRVDGLKQSISCRLKGACAFPSNASDTEYYHIDGIEGIYYYKSVYNNQLLGIPFSAGITFNYET